MTAATTINIPANAETHRLRRFLAVGTAVVALTASGTLVWRVAAHEDTAPRYQGPVAPYVPVEIPRYQGPVAPFAHAPNLAELGILLDTPE